MKEKINMEELGLEEEDREWYAEEIECLSMDNWHIILNFKEQVIDTVKTILNQKAVLGSKEQQKRILSNITELYDLVDNLLINRLKYPVAYDYEGVKILRSFLNICRQLLKEYPQFVNDQLKIRDNLTALVKKIEEYLEHIRSDDYYRKSTGSDWLPTDIKFDSQRKIETELSKEQKESHLLLEESKKLLEELKGRKNSVTLSQNDINTVASNLISDYHNKKKKIELFWKLMKEEK